MLGPIAIEGIGLHTGDYSRVVVEPGSKGSPVVLQKDGLEIEVCPDSLASTAILATTLSRGTTRVSTVEHLFSALNAYGETSVRIVVEGPEVPILDGSALQWAQALESNGSKQNPRFLKIEQEVEIRDLDSVARVMPLRPNQAPSIKVTVDFSHTSSGKQEATFFPLSTNYIREIAPARTFAFESDIDKIRGQGLGLGGSLDNALVIGTHGAKNRGGMRFKNELARHKLLDAIGDLFLLGGIPFAKVELIRPGHNLMHALVKQMKPLCKEYIDPASGDQP